MVCNDRANNNMWYVVQVFTGEESECIDLCKRLIDSSIYENIFVPMYVCKKRYAGEWHDELKVLFPGYMFIETENIDDVIGELKRIPTLTKVIKSADEVTPITEEEQKFLMDMLDDDYVLRVSQGMIIGDTVEITEGPLQYYSGKIKHIDRHKRTAQIEVDWFGGINSVTVGLEIISKSN